MFNPLHLAFTVLGRMLDLIIPRPQARSGPGDRLEIGIVSWERRGDKRDGGSSGVELNSVTGLGRDVGARRVTNASPEWAERLRDAEARANVRADASSRRRGHRVGARATRELLVRRRVSQRS
jgi:hypothetical protein